MVMSPAPAALSRKPTNTKAALAAVPTAGPALATCKHTHTQTPCQLVQQVLDRAGGRTSQSKAHASQLIQKPGMTSITCR
jgi:hypothetical protein